MLRLIRSTRRWVLAAAAPVVLVCSWYLPSGASPGEPECGSFGSPACPLQAWMRNEVARPYANRDAAQLGRALAELAEYNPAREEPQWRAWDRITARGVGATKTGNRDRTTATCVDCHRHLRRHYIERFRRHELAHGAKSAEN